MCRSCDYYTMSCDSHSPKMSSSSRWSSNTSMSLTTFGWSSFFKMAISLWMLSRGLFTCSCFSGRGRAPTVAWRSRGVIFLGRTVGRREIMNCSVCVCVCVRGTDPIEDHNVTSCLVHVYIYIYMYTHNTHTHTHTQYMQKQEHTWLRTLLGKYTTYFQYHNLYVHHRPLNTFSTRYIYTCTQAS